MSGSPHKPILVAALCSLFAASPVFGQDAMSGMDMSSIQQTTPEAATPTAKSEKPAKKAQETMPKRNADSMSGMDMSSTQDMNQAMQQPPTPTTGELQRLDIGRSNGVRPVVRGLDLQRMGDMQGMNMQMQGGRAPPDARSPDYSDGNEYGSMTGMDMHDDAPLGLLLVDQLEYFTDREANGVALDAQAWYGNDRNKLWLKADGERSGGALQDLRGEALWDHSVATYWDTQLGVRHDFGVGPDRTWAAFGVQGLAPYWFDIEATAYVGQSGRTAARFEVEYDLRLTQRLIFQPDLEARLYGRDDPQRRIGSGLSDVEFGLRLRYEFHRQFAPYFGIDLVRKFGHTADFAHAAGQPAFEPQLVAGMRTWF